MFGASKMRNQQPSPYATRADFCQVFQKDMNRLYLLSLLLTADATMAEQCFVGGLHIAQEGNPVFKEWAESWARRAIILNAIRMVRPGTIRPGMAGKQAASGDTSLAAGSGGSEMLAAPAEIARIVALPASERFVFVMSVLEHYTDQDCSLLLGCTRGDVTAARTRALQQIQESADVHADLHGNARQESARTYEDSRHDGAKSAPQPDAIPLGASA